MPVNTHFRYALFAATVTTLCLFQYWESINLPLDTHDDETLADNELIRADPLIFFSTDKQQFTGRPVAEAAKFLIGLPLDDDTRPFHLANILFHSANCALLAWLVARVSRNESLAALTAVLFAVSPVHHQAVHHMSALDYLLSGGFALGAVHAMLGSKATWALALACLSILSHAAGFAPLALLALHSGHRRGYLAGLAFVGLAGLVLAITPDHTSTGTALRGWTDGVQSLWDFIRAYLWLAGRHATALLWHLPMTLSFAEWELWTGSAVLLCGGALLCFAGGSVRLKTAVVVASILPFAFMITDITSGHTGGSSRYCYLSAMGFCWLVCLGVVRLLERLGDARTRRWGPVTIGAAIAIIAHGAERETHVSSLYSTARSRLANYDTRRGTELMLQVLRSPHSRLLDIEDLYMRLGVVSLLVLDRPERVIAEGHKRYPDNYTLLVCHLAVQAFAGDRNAYLKLRELGTRLENIGIVSAYIFNNLGIRHRELGDLEQAIRAYQCAYDSTADEKYVRLIKELQAESSDHPGR